MKNSFNVIKADIKACALYSCSVCGAVEAGTPFSISITTSNTSELKDKLDSAHISNNNMPVGWSSSYYSLGLAVYKCPACKNVCNEKKI